MRAFLFGWNPMKFDWPDIGEDIAKLRAGEVVEDSWSAASHKTIGPGDRAFVVRVGVEPKGIFASGVIASDPYVAYRNGRHYYRVNIRFDTLIDPDRESILTLDILKTGNLAKQTWTPQASGISIRPELAEELEGVWQDFLENAET